MGDESFMLSIIVPVYKVEPFINRCVESILNQTYQDLEVILVDDGSPDNCGKICDDFAEKDKRVRVIHKVNGGQSSARNAGLNEMRGGYFTFVDGDDWLDPDMYQDLIELAEKNDADIVEGGYRFFRPWKVENKILEAKDTGEVKEFTNIEALHELYYGPQMFGGLAIMVWTKIYRTSALGHLRFSEGYILEDREYTPKAFFSANKILKIEKTFYNYNIHLGTASTSGMGTNLLKVRSSIHIGRKLCEYFSGCHERWIDNYQKTSYYESLMNAYYESWKQKNNPEFVKLQQEILLELTNEKEDVLCKLPEKKTKLFYISPLAFCLAKNAVIGVRRCRYKLYVKLTGKN